MNSHYQPPAKLKLANKFTQGIECFDKHEYDQAIGFFSEILVTYPNHIGSLAYRGMSYYELDQTSLTDFAISDFNEALALDSSIHELHYYRGITYHANNEFGDAVKDLKYALELSPKTALYNKVLAEVYVDVGKSFHDDEKYNDAHKYFKLASEWDPENINAIMGRGLVCYEVNHLESAIKRFQQALNLNLQHPGCHYYLGMSYLKTKKFENAINYLKQAVSLALAQNDSNITLYQKALADIYLDMYYNEKNNNDDLALSWFNKSIKCFNEILMRDPQNIGTLIARAAAYLQNDDIDNAIEDYKLLLGFQPHNDPFHYNLGMCYYTKGDIDQAQQHLEKAEHLGEIIKDDLSEEDQELNYNLEMYDKALIDLYFDISKNHHKEKNYENAVKYITAVLNRNKKNADAFIFRASLFLDIDELDEAIEDYKQAVALNPGDYQYHNCLARTYVKNKKFQHAEAHFAIANTLEKIEDCLETGYALSKENKSDQAIDAFKNAIDLDPDYKLKIKTKDLPSKRLIKIYLKAADLFLISNDYNSAINYFNRALFLDQKNINVLMKLGLANAEFGNLKEAIYCYDKVLKLDPCNKESYYYLGLLYQNEKDLGEAKYHLQKAVELAPHKNSYQQALQEIDLEIAEYNIAIEAANKNTHEFRVEASNIHFDDLNNPLGKGSYATVHKALCEGKEVAVKCISLNPKLNPKQPRPQDDIQKEKTICLSLQHPNILNFRKYAITLDNFMFIMDLMEGGTLFDRLRNHPKNPFTFAEKENILCMLAAAVAYLHELNIIHCDLKPENIFFDKANIVKIGDFGLSNRIDIDPELTNAVGTLHYFAPELMGDKPNTKASDIWALAVIFWEIVEGQFAFKDPLLKYNEDFISHVVTKSKKGETLLEHSQNWPSSVAILKQQGLLADPSKRPTAKEESETLQKNRPFQWGVVR